MYALTVSVTECTRHAQDQDSPNSSEDAGRAHEVPTQWRSYWQPIAGHGPIPNPHTFWGHHVDSVGLRKHMNLRGKCWLGHRRSWKGESGVDLVKPHWGTVGKSTKSSVEMRLVRRDYDQLSVDGMERVGTERERNLWGQWGSTAL